MNLNLPKIPGSAITPKDVFLNRRQVLAGASAISAGMAFPAAGALVTAPSKYSTTEKPTGRQFVTQHNNFYEFGTDKGDPAAYAGKLTVKPWTVRIDGLVARPGDYALEDIVPATLEERIYRLRCVEAWSMVVPWNGFPLADLLARVEPLGSAKFVAFETLVRPSEMPGQSGLFQPLAWPYVEGLRLDEAMHPLTILATGVYGEPMPNQNGAPIRLVAPWKYGFKSIKSIVRISLTETQPPTTWNLANPREYGFYSNVNPEVDHPRWSQAMERPVGEGLFARAKPTLMFNGYGEHVAALYAGMDLRANF
jgi:sulfoxide reductase catalytic subunit YedY